MSSTPNGTLASSFLIEPLPELREVTNVPSRPENGDVLTLNTIADGRLIDRNSRKRLRVFGAGNRLADGDTSMPAMRDDIARFGVVSIDALHAFEGVELGDLGLSNRPSSLQIAISSPRRASRKYSTNRQPSRDSRCSPDSPPGIAASRRQRPPGGGIVLRIASNSGRSYRSSSSRVSVSRRRAWQPCRGRESRADLRWHPDR